MAGAKDSASRLGVTLQGYHQVIALSQGNINESLEYHFRADPDLCKFEAKIKTGSKESLIGTIIPPTVELIDEENADRALYILQFKAGTYSYWDYSDEDNPKRAKKETKGWKLAFYADFALKQMANVPEQIRKVVENPGLYSVSQLLIDFGTAELLDFNWDRCVITGLDPDDKNAAKTRITLFVADWLNQLKAKDNTGSHNILAYAVKVDAEKANLPQQEVLKKVNPDAPSFPPTSVRLQTINYRPGGDASKARPDHDHNAFLFTEMTNFDKMLGTDLAWSGDLFYESIGGTLIMSRHIFWDQFLLPKLKEISQQNLESALKGASDMADALRTRLGHIVPPSKTEYKGQWMDEGLGCRREFEFDLKSYLDTKYVDDADMKFRVQDTIEPMIGQGAVKIKHHFMIRTEWHHKGNSGSGPTEEISWEDRLFFKSVTNSAVLVAEYRSGLDGIMPKDGEVEKDPLKDLWKAMKDLKYEVNLKTGIENALNKQGRFIFPGGGDFEMKDPIFNNALDLMIGLTYKKGEAAS